MFIKTIVAMIAFWTLIQLIIEESKQKELLPLFKLAIALFVLQFIIKFV